MWVVVDILAKVNTPKLEVANVFEEGVYSKENRSFFINPLGEGEGERGGAGRGRGTDSGICIFSIIIRILVFWYLYSQAQSYPACSPAGNGLPMWAPGAAIIPALLATILLFMDQHITAIIINKKDNKLQV